MDWFMWDLSGTRIFLYSATLKLDLKKRAVELLSVEWMRWFRGGFQLVCWFEVRSIPWNWLKKSQNPPKKNIKNWGKGNFHESFSAPRARKNDLDGLEGVKFCFRKGCLKIRRGPRPRWAHKKKSWVTWIECGSCLHYLFFVQSDDLTSHQMFVFCREGSEISQWTCRVISNQFHKEKHLPD